MDHEHKKDSAIPTPEQIEKFLSVMDKAEPQGAVRMAVQLGTDESGEPIGIICWRKSNGT